MADYGAELNIFATAGHIAFEHKINVWRIVSSLHQNEGGIGKHIPDAQEISRDLILRAEGNLEGLDLPFYHHLQGRIGFNTVRNPSRSTGMEFTMHSLEKEC